MAKMERQINDVRFRSLLTVASTSPFYKLAKRFVYFLKRGNHFATQQAEEKLPWKV